MPFCVPPASLSPRCHPIAQRNSTREPRSFQCGVWIARTFCCGVLTSRRADSAVRLRSKTYSNTSSIGRQPLQRSCPSQRGSRSRGLNSARPEQIEGSRSDRGETESRTPLSAIRALARDAATGQSRHHAPFPSRTAKRLPRRARPKLPVPLRGPRDKTPQPGRDVG